MELYCTRPSCSKPKNFCADLDDPAVLKSTEQKYCTSCGMPLFLQGRYLTTRLLGQGGFGAAFLACDRLTPKLRPCVVKQFKPAMQLNPQQQALAHQLFEKEAEVLDQLGLENPHIPDLFAFFDLTIPQKATGQTDRLFYIVQEFIDGVTMEAAWTAGTKLDQSTLLELLHQLLPVLSYIHSHNVIHRDIKPSNIMRHQNGRFYLLDFGAIRDATKAGAKTSTSIYSLGYAPPEQVAGQEVFFSSDLYALAATCVVLLTGQEPRDLFNSATNHWQWSAPVDRPIAQMLDKMLAPNPADRFFAASEALQALAAATGRAVAQPTTQMQPPPVANPVANPPVANPPTAAPSPVRPAVGTAPLPINPTPPQPIVPPPPRARSARSSGTSQPTFSLPEYLKGAVFTGFEGALLAIGLNQLPLPIVARGGLWLAIALVLIFLQSQRIIEKVDLLILAAITLLIVGLVVRPDLQFLLLAIGGGICLGVAIGALFRLLYQLLAKIL
jgi:serine/threonine protein kinase